MQIISTISNKSLFLKDILETSDIIRLNCSHLNREWIEQLLSNTKNFPPLFLDLQGHKIRVSTLFDKEQKLFNNEIIYLCSEDYYIKNNLKFKKDYIPLNFKTNLAPLTNVKKVLVNNETEFKILKFENDSVLKVQVSGECILRKEKGINFVGYDRRNLPISQKDQEDLLIYLKYKPKYVCYSFTESKDNLLEIKELLISHPEIKLIAKIESQYGLDNIVEILEYCDGVLLGRGDLSKEVCILDIAEIQDSIINTCLKNNKEIFIGTDILATMIRKQTPSVSEIMALSYFKEKNITGIMLSDETVIGKNPVKCINVCKEILKKEV